MVNGPEIHARLLARNTALNLVGQTVPLVVGLATIPYVVHGLGVERFGILSIAWVLFGYFSLFDLGLGRATTKFVADCLGRGELHDLPALVWTSLASQVILGLGGALLVAVATPFLVDRALKIPPSLIGQTKLTLYILACSLPIVLGSNSLRGVLEAAQRFDLANYVRLPANSAVFLAPALALPFGFNLPGIVMLLALTRLGGGLAYLVMCLKTFPALRSNLKFHRGKLRVLAIYGGWVTVSNVVSPLLVYMDRFLIGSLLSMSALAYYTAPCDMVTRLLFFPSSLVAALFPAFSSLDASGETRRVEEIYARSIKFLLLIFGPVLLLVAVFAQDILRLWLGADFALKSTSVLQILAVGVLFNSLACVPFTLLQGIERPDLTAKFHLIELPVELGLLWFLVGRMGIVGAALAWTLRVGIDAFLLFGACYRLRLVTLRTLRECGLLRSINPFLGLALSLSLTLIAVEPHVLRAILSGVFVALFAVVSWRHVLDSRERLLLEASVSHVLVTFRIAR